MSELPTDVEQAAAIRAWWSSHGLSVLLTLVLAGAAYGGWQFWQAQLAEKRGEIAELYFDLHEVLRAGDQGRLDASLATPEPALSTAKRLKEQYPDSMHAVFASLYLAHSYMADKEFRATTDELNWALERTDFIPLKDIIRLRLARVYAANGDSAFARASLDALQSISMAPYAEEIRGDMAFAEKDFTAAAAAYQNAKTQFTDVDGGAVYVDWKLQGLPFATASDSDAGKDETAVSDADAPTETSKLDQQAKPQAQDAEAVTESGAP